MATKTGFNISKNIASVKIAYHTPALPPPFSYAYTITVKYVQKGLDFDFVLTYVDRDEIEEEEIFAEGFTLEDDYQSEGTLPTAWAGALEEQIRKTSWVNDKKDAPLAIKIVDKDNRVFEGAPADMASWEYFLQELMQGVFEVGKKELPLEVQYREVVNKADDLAIKLQVSFAERTSHVTYTKGAEQSRKKPLPWKDLKKFLKSIFTPDYFTEMARPQLPSKKGRYINPGDGKWYEFGKAVQSPSKKVDSLLLLENQFKQAVSELQNN